MVLMQSPRRRDPRGDVVPATFDNARNATISTPPTSPAGRSFSDVLMQTSPNNATEETSRHIAQNQAQAVQDGDATLVESLRKQLRDKDLQLAAKDQQLAAQNQRFAAYDLKFAAYDQKIADLETEVHQLRATGFDDCKAQLRREMQDNMANLKADAKRHVQLEHEQLQQDVEAVRKQVQTNTTRLDKHKQDFKVMQGDLRAMVGVAESQLEAWEEATPRNRRERNLVAVGVPLDHNPDTALSDILDAVNKGVGDQQPPRVTKEDIVFHKRLGQSNVVVLSFNTVEKRNTVLSASYDVWSAHKFSIREDLTKKQQKHVSYMRPMYNWLRQNREGARGPFFRRGMLYYHQAGSTDPLLHPANYDLRQAPDAVQEQMRENRMQLWPEGRVYMPRRSLRSAADPASTPPQQPGTARQA